MPILARFTAVNIDIGAFSGNDNVRRIFLLVGFSFLQSADNELFVCRK
jgi:hypothetical protein